MLFNPGIIGALITSYGISFSEKSNRGIQLRATAFYVFFIFHFLPKIKERFLIVIIKLNFVVYKRSQNWMKTHSTLLSICSTFVNIFKVK